MEYDKARTWIADLAWLLVGCACLLFMGGKWNILIVTWLGSIFILRYFRRQRTVWGVLLALPPILVAARIFFVGLAEQVTSQFLILIAASYTLYIVIPCVVDRLLYRRMGSPLLSTLVYPAALIGVQLLLSFVEQIGTVMTWTGFLFGMKPLIQLVAVTGVWGPSFLVGWLASTVNTLWEAGWDLRAVRWPAALLAGVFVAVTLWGGIRLAFFAPQGGTVKIGSVVVGLPQDNLFYTYLDLPEAEQASRQEQYRQWSHQVQDQMFAASEGLIPAGIEILAWPSGNAVVFADEEAQLVARLQAFAAAHQVYFFPSLLVLGEYAGPDRNRVLAIRPDGEIEYVHFKGRNPNLGYYEGERLEVIDTPYGRIASPICFEMEFHRYIRQAGQQNVDILIVPGDEPARDAAIIHTEISAFRGIENGASLLRTTLEGLTLGMDYQGRVLSQMNYYVTKEDRTVITELPVRGVRTLYTRWGDWFAYGCVLLLVVLVGRGLWRGRRG